MGAGLPRRLGRSDRQASRFALRTSPFSALAEDEVRGIAGTGGRRLHRSSGNASGSAHCCSGYFEGEDFVFAGKVGTGFDMKQLVDLRSRLDKIEIAASPFTRAAADCRGSARIGCGLRSLCRSRLSNGRSTAS